MTRSATVRYCANPEALAALKRDGLGWGHDLDCGCFRTQAPVRKRGAIAKWFQKRKGA